MEMDGRALRVGGRRGLIEMIEIGEAIDGIGMTTTIGHERAIIDTNVGIEIEGGMEVVIGIGRGIRIGFVSHLADVDMTMDTAVVMIARNASSRRKRLAMTLRKRKESKSNAR